MIGRNYITDRDSAPVQCNDSIVHRWYWYTNILWLTIFDQSEPVAHPYRKEKWVKGTLKVSRSSTGEIVEDYEPLEKLPTEVATGKVMCQHYEVRAVQADISRNPVLLKAF